MTRLFAILLLLAQVAFGSTYYVSTSGNDSTGDGSIGTPWRTIGYGMTNMSGGDTLYIRGGDYLEANICDHSSTTGYCLHDGADEDHRTLISSYPGERAVFFPTNASCPSGHGFGLGAASTSREGPKFITISGITIDLSHRPCWTTEAQQDAFGAYNAHHLTFTNCYFLNTTNGSMFQLLAQTTDSGLDFDSRWGNSNIVTSCLFSNVNNVDIDGDGDKGPAQHPIYCHPVLNFIVEDCTFRYGQATAISLGTDTGDPYDICTNAIVRRCDISDFLYGINLRRTRASQAYNNLIRNISVGTDPHGTNFNKYAIWVHGASNIVANNTIYHVDRAIGMNRANSYSEMTITHDNQIHNNLIWDATNGLYWVNNPSYPTTGTNYFTNNWTTTISGDSGWETWWADQIMSGTVTNTDPLFADAPDDLSLSASSDAIDGGVDLSSIFTTDYLGATRSGTWDIGAYEYAGVSGTEFITVRFGSPTIRNDYTGLLGFQTTIGGSALTLESIGRWILSGNSSTHLLKVLSHPDHSVVASVAIDTSAYPTNAFGYVPIGSNVVLQAGGTYFVVSQETNGGDQWYNSGGVQYTTVAVINQSVYAGWNGTGATNNSYIPVSFTYSYAPAGQPSSPDPSDTETGVAIDTDLSWTAADYATNYLVYFADSSPPLYVGSTTNVTYDPGTLDANTTYYWRVDSVSAAGTTTGDEWSFETTAAPASFTTFHVGTLTIVAPSDTNLPAGALLFNGSPLTFGGDYLVFP